MYGYSKKNSVTNKIIVMKTRYFLFVFLLCFFFSCAEEDNMVISNEMLTESSLQMEQAKIAIYAMGLDTTFISEWDRYYVVEEDILVCKDSVNLSRTLTRQYKTTYHVANFQTITIGVDNTIASNTNWREAVQEVIVLYNKYTGLKFVYTEDDPDIKIICEKIIGNGVENNTLKNELLNYSDMFCNYMEQYSHNNLRTFQFFISKVSYLVKKMEQASIKDYEIEVRKYIIEETFICAIEYKSNYQEPSEEWERALIKVRPRMLSVKMYVETGQFIYKNFNKELNKYVDEQILNNIDSQDPLNLLSNYYYENSQKWCEDKIDEIKGKLKDNKYPTFSYGRILICVQCLIDIGFELSIEEFKRLMSINISKTDRLYEIDLINLKFENPKIRDKIISDITDINKFILNKKNKNKAKSVREILKDEDWVQELENIIDEYNIVYDSDVNIFHEISVSELKNTVINSSSENIIKFRRILNSLYPLDYCRKVNCLDDVVLLKELRENIDPQEINDLIVRKNLEWLIEQIKETETIYLNK